MLMFTGVVAGVLAVLLLEISKNTGKGLGLVIGFALLLLIRITARTCAVFLVVGPCILIYIAVTSHQSLAFPIIAAVAGIVWNVRLLRPHSRTKEPRNAKP